MQLSSDCIVKTENFDSMVEYESHDQLTWPCVFMLPAWIKTWWKSFGALYEPCLLSVHHKDMPIGLAMLKKQGQEVSFLGSADVCDYLDFIVAPGKESLFFSALFDHLAARGVTGMDLRCLRPDSVAATFLPSFVRDRGYLINSSPDGVSFEVELPDTWDDYLKQLKSKQRHEVKRKLRRLYESGDVELSVYDDMHRHEDKMDLFFQLFSQSREDKSDFLTPQMAGFFKDMIFSMSNAHILKLGVLSVNHQPAAAIIFFDFNNSYYLYNNGYDLNFQSLSIGVLSKVLALDHGIQMKKQVFDFLKGTEKYKSRLGGQEVQLDRFQISFS